MFDKPGYFALGCSSISSFLKCTRQETESVLKWLFFTHGFTAILGSDVTMPSHVFRLPDLWSDNLLAWRCVRPSLHIFIVFSNIQIFLKICTKILKNTLRRFFLFLKISIFDKMAAIFVEKRAILDFVSTFLKICSKNFFLFWHMNSLSLYLSAVLTPF